MGKAVCKTGERHVLYSPRLICAILEVMKRVDDKLRFDSADFVAFLLMVLRLRAEEMLDQFLFLRNFAVDR